MTKKRFRLSPIAVFTLLAAIILAAIILLQKPSDRGSQAPAPNKPRIAATIFPLYDIARNIAGDNAEVVLVVPPGASPHTFEPLPSNIRELRGAVAIYAVGHGLDDWTEKLTAATGVERVLVDDSVNLSDLRENSEDEDGQAAGPGHDGLDPHYWLTMANGARIAHTIAEDLKRRLPNAAAAIDQRQMRYFEELAAADREMRRLLSGTTNRNIVTLHDAWYYFARAYDLRVAGTFEPTAGREPTPQYLKELTDGIRSTGVKVLYSEPQLASQSIASFLADNGLTLAILDPSGGVPGRDSYINMMIYNARTISQNQ
ncbi:MAG: metal ABC transporter substrate-binding protein [Patescibacteria group bacterium]|jgi:ABC-type Zn uptake system ZnuABC Zn-binding protein ZnuA